MMYLIKYKDKYCRFQSYSQTRLVDEPEKATLYARRRDAEAKLSFDTWYKNIILDPKDLVLYEAEFTHVLLKKIG